MRLLAIGLSLFVFLGQPWTLAQEKGKWQEFSSKEGRFTVLMPGIPNAKKNNIPGPDDSIVQQKIFLVDNKTAAYLVAYQDNPAEIGKAEENKALEKMRDGVKDQFKGKLLETKDMKLADKYKGIEFQVEIAEPKGIYRSRIYLVGKRLYQVSVVGMADIATSKESDQFLDSFKLAK
jgi:hypothetical protein